MLNHITEISRQRLARMTGFSYLMIIAAGIIAEFAIRGSLIESGNAALTASNIASSEDLFRLSIIGDITMLVFDVVVAAAFYVLLRPINKTLALLASLLRLMQAAVLGANLMNLVAVTQLLAGSDFTAGMDTGRLSSLAMMFLEIHAVGYSIGLVFFGLATVVVGYLLRKSGLVPGILGTLLTVAGPVYIVGSFIHVMAPEHVNSFEMAYGVPFIAELSIALWLVIKGVRSTHATERRMVAATA